jgi:hypothetical protein
MKTPTSNLAIDSKDDIETLTEIFRDDNSIVEDVDRIQVVQVVQDSNKGTESSKICNKNL